MTQYSEKEGYTLSAHHSPTALRYIAAGRRALAHTAYSPTAGGAERSPISSREWLCIPTAGRVVR
eukprot:12928764-Prorocentrum_lima.AAC.1